MTVDVMALLASIEPGPRLIDGSVLKEILLLAAASGSGGGGTPSIGESQIFVDADPIPQGLWVVTVAGYLVDSTVGWVDSIRSPAGAVIYSTGQTHSLYGSIGLAPLSM